MNGYDDGCITQGSGYRSVLDLPGNKWKEVLQEWISSSQRMVMKELSRMDVAVCNRNLREVWWRKSEIFDGMSQQLIMGRIVQ